MLYIRFASLLPLVDTGICADHWEGHAMPMTCHEVTAPDIASPSGRTVLK